ncbi:unnamed protein product [Auanema sp. JU1783]|nr:unnamed protein product [Auanema sp. JU1783]
MTTTPRSLPSTNLYHHPNLNSSIFSTAHSAPDPYGKTTPKYNYPHATTPGHPLHSSTTKHVAAPNFDTLDLALVIGIPCLTMVCALCICAMCCIKCSKHRQTAIERWGWKTNNQNQNHKKHLQQHHPHHHPAPSAPYHDNSMKNFAEANHYMDINLIAAKKDHWEVSCENLEIDHDCLLGNGAFAFVYKGQIHGEIPLLKAERGISLSLEHRKNGKHEVAVKRLPAHADHQNRLDFFHEIDFMKKLGYHSHVIAMLGCVSDPEDPLIVVEFCQKGDLLKLLRNNRADNNHPDMEKRIDFRVKDLVSIAWQICDGMTYLDSKGFIHRDLAARNILITQNMVAKVSDFGLCRYVDSSLYVAKGGKLPIKWMALESLKFYEYSSKSDVWAYGVTLFELFSFGDGPYPAIQPLDMIKYLEDGNRLLQPKMCPNEIFALMELCWSRDKEKRPTFGELRGKVAILLNLEDEHYGYLTVQQEDETRRGNEYISSEAMKLKQNNFDKDLIITNHNISEHL